MIRTLSRALPWILLLCLVSVGARADAGFDEEIAILTERLRLGSGARAADLGAGEGDWSVAFAEAVGATGRVYATELDPERLATLRERKEAGALSQLEVVEGRVDGTGLEPASVDGAMLRDVYHHVTDPQPFVASLFATIRPGGRLVVVDFPPTFWLALFTPEGIPENRGGHGITRDLLVSEFEAAGFVVVADVDPWPSSNFVTKTYGVVFDRP